ncbi:MAG: hypothetical protein HOF87_00470 [Gemmatimonadales bacterium]|nr:hypothetical protein [Gemmatimonadales bacterium]
MVDLPNWSQHDASRTPSLPEHAERPGRLVVVLTTRGARRDGFAIDAVLGMVTGWSAEGRRVVLADVGLDEPSLHAAVDAPNAEGVGDVVLFGSSVRRVARAAPHGGYFFIGAGTGAADPSQVLGHGRWDRLCRGFLDAGVTLVAFAHAECPGTEHVLRVATDIVVLANEDEDVSGQLAEAAGVVCLVSGPSTAVSGQASLAVLETDSDLEAHLFETLEVPEDEGEGNHPEVGPRDEPSDIEFLPDAESMAPELEPPLAPEVDEAVVSGSILGDEGAGEVAAPGSRNRVLLGLSTLMLAMVGAAVMGWVQIPGLSPEVPIVPSAEGPLQVARSVPLAESTLMLSHSVAVGAFQDETVAMSRLTGLQAAAGVFAILAPVRVDGTVYYRVLVGPATDSMSAETLANRLALETAVSSASWVVRTTPLAFELGELLDEEATAQRVEVLRGLGVPAYSLAIDFSDGTTRYRVYAGAYVDEQEASYLQSHLIAQGLDNATLTTRIGRVQ